MGNGYFVLISFWDGEYCAFIRKELALKVLTVSVKIELYFANYLL